jgi:hypothetical protein
LDPAVEVAEVLDLKEHKDPTVLRVHKVLMVPMEHKEQPGLV